MSTSSLSSKDEELSEEVMVEGSMGYGRMDRGHRSKCTPEPECVPKPRCPPKPKCVPKPKCPPKPVCVPKPPCVPKPKCPPKEVVKKCCVKKVPCDPCQDKEGLMDLDPAAVLPKTQTMEDQKLEMAKVCGSPLYKRVFTLVGSGKLCSQNAVLNVGGGKQFQQSIMGRDESAASDNVADAEKFFAQQYGLDFGSVGFEQGIKKIKDAELFAFQLNTKLQHRVYTVSGSEQQPLGSIKVWMGGWAARITSDGHRFGGVFGNNEGKCRRYDEGTIILFGDYKLQGFTEKQVKTCVKNECDPCAKPMIRISTHTIPEGDAQVVSFYSNSPLVPNMNRQLVIDNVIVAGDTGRSNGIITIESAGDDTNAVNVSIHEVWTF